CSRPTSPRTRPPPSRRRPAPHRTPAATPKPRARLRRPWRRTCCARWSSAKRSSAAGSWTSWRNFRTCSTPAGRPAPPWWCAWSARRTMRWSTRCATSCCPIPMSATSASSCSRPKARVASASCSARPTEPARTWRAHQHRQAGVRHRRLRRRHSGAKRFAPGVQQLASGLLDELGFELHRTKPLDLAVDVVVLVDQADLPHLGARLLRRTGALDLQVLDDGDGVTVGQHVADRVAVNDGVLRGARGLATGPLVAALGA